MRLYKSSYLLVYFLYFCTSVHTANHYVDRNANGNNNGTSWTNAWESFSDINWDSVNAGDTVWISGGTSGQTYTEQLNVQASGNANADLVIRAGLDAGHNGTVTISVGNVGNVYGIDIDGSASKREYITISNITITESSFGVRIVNKNTIGNINNITLDSLTITQFGRSDGGDSFGIYIYGGYDTSDSTEHIDSIFITNCTISIIDTLDSQTDGIVGKFAQNIFIDNTDVLIDNRIYATNASEPPHNDCVQFFSNTSRVGIYNLTITNSRLINLAGVDRSLFTTHKTLHAHNVQTHDLGGTIILYNNTIENPYGFGYTNMIYDRAVEYDEHWILVHNTITSRSSVSTTTLHDDDVILKNNIFYTDTLPNDGYQFTVEDYEPGIDINETITNHNQIDGNLWSSYCYDGDNTDIINVGDNHMTMAELVTAGGESSGNYLNRDRVDPLFVSYTSSQPMNGTGGTWDLHLQSGSPAIDEGANLQSYIEGLGLEWKDKDGKLRDSTPDCGAYQYVP